MQVDIQDREYHLSETDRTIEDIRQGMLDYEAGLGEPLPAAFECIRDALKQSGKVRWGLF